MYHSRDRYLGMMGVLVHLLGGAINNVGVIIAGLIIWFASFDHRYYADPGVSMAIALLIFISSIPLGNTFITCEIYLSSLNFLVRNSARILLQSVPPNVNISEVQRDLEMVL